MDAPGSKPASGTVKPLACGRCGGSYDAEAPSCPWCGGGIALEDRRVAALCAGCGSRIGSNDRFCARCGRARPSDRIGNDVGAACPRCACALRARAQEGLDVVECSSCGGLWFASGELERWLESARSRGVAALDTRASARPTVEAAPKYRACPACKDMMPRRNFGGSSGTIVDVCGRHGVWLDPGELESIASFVARGGLERERERRDQRERARENAARAPRDVLDDTRFDERSEVSTGILRFLWRCLT